MGKATSDIRNFFQRLPKATKVEETAKNLNNLGKPMLKGLQKVQKLVMEPLRSHKLLPLSEPLLSPDMSEPLLSPDMSEPLFDISDAEHGSPIRKRHEVDDYYTKQMRQLEGYTEIETMSETGCDPGNPAEVMEPSSDAPPSQTPVAQVELAAQAELATQAEPVATPTNAEVMEPFSDAPPSQTTPVAQVELAAQVEPVATPTNVMEPFSDAPPSQTIPVAQIELVAQVQLAAQVEPVATATNAKDEMKHGERMAILVTNIANIVLFALKVFASIESKSLSIIAAILDPFFDLLWGFTLWLTSYAMQNPNPHKYPIGKERMQPVGMIVFGSFGLQLLFLAAKQFITKSKPTKDPQKQKWMIGVMTFVTMVEFMVAFYCRRFENKIVRAYAEHHSSNVKTNLISLAAAVLAIRYYWWIDPTGAIIILLYTMHSWKKTFLENLFALIGRTAPPEILDRLTSLVLEHHEDIKQIGRLTAYTSGLDQYFVEVDIVLPQDMVQSKTRDIVGTLQVKLLQLPEVARATVREYASRAEHRIMVDDKDDDEDCKN